MNKDYVLVDEPLIKYVIDRAKGVEFSAEEFVSTTARDFAQIRLGIFDSISRGEPNIICAACHAPVYPRKHLSTKKFHFVHLSGDGNITCPYKEKGARFDTERIDSMRYNGQKEGPDHKSIKSLLKASIDADPGFDHGQTMVEKNWYGATDKKKWRRPDIAATRNLNSKKDVKVAFEIQLSSTYLKVIAARREFYLNNNALLFWIFKDAAGVLDPRQYQDDLFYNNNSNLFVVDEETLRLSREKRKLTFRCYYQKPVLEGTSVIDVWRECFVSFDELTIDIGNQKVYLFDYDVEFARLQKECWQIAREKNPELCERYEDFWIQYCREGNKCNVGEYGDIRDSLSCHEIFIPERPDREIIRFNRIVFSAKAGKNVMTGFKTLLEVANDAYSNGEPFMWYFGRVLQYYGNWEKLLEQDGKAKRNKKSGKKHLSWEEKAEIIKIGYREGGEFVRDHSYDKLFFFLFPEISESHERSSQEKQTTLLK